MKKKLLTIALLITMPILSSHSNNSVERSVTKETLATVCVDWRVEGAGPNIAYFYTKSCADLFQSLNGGIVKKGTMCVDEVQVFICL